MIKKVREKTRRTKKQRIFFSLSASSLLRLSRFEEEPGIAQKSREKSFSKRVACFLTVNLDVGEEHIQKRVVCLFNTVSGRHQAEN